MRMLISCTLALSALAPAVLAPAVLASQSVRGRIIDARTALPLRDVSIVVTAGRDTLSTARSDSDGVFQATAKTGPVIAHFARAGYHADSLASEASAELPLRVAMIPLGVTGLASGVAKDTARALSGFEQRARRNSGGIFLRQEDIEKRRPVHTSDLFRFLAGVTVADSAGHTLIVSTRGGRQAATSGGRTSAGSSGGSIPTSNARVCALRVGTDGRLMPREYSIDDVRPEDISAIEVYLGAATIPLEYQSVQRDGPCGIIMVWTKTGLENGQ